MFPHSPTLTLILNNLPLPIEPHPNHLRKCGNGLFVGGLRCFAQNCGKTKEGESGRFWSILVNCFPIVSPLNFMWGNINKNSYDYNSNRI